MGGRGGGRGVDWVGIDGREEGGRSARCLQEMSRWKFELVDFFSEKF